MSQYNLRLRTKIPQPIITKALHSSQLATIPNLPTATSSQFNSKSVIMAPKVATMALMTELGIDTTNISRENKVLVNLIIGGVKKLLDTQYQEEREAQNSRLASMENRMKTLEDRVTALEKENQDLHTKNAALNVKSDDLENYGRRNTIVISGSSLPASTKDENCIDVATDVIRAQLGLTSFSRTDIDVAHRLGKPRPGSQDKRSMIVKLVRRENKRTIFNACRIKKPVNLFFNESVSRTRSSILYVLRKASKDFPTKFGSCTTEDGNIKIRLPTPEDPSKFTKETVNTRHALDILLRTRINADSSKYNPTWSS